MRKSLFAVTTLSVLVVLAGALPATVFASEVKAHVVIAVEHVGGFVAPSFRSARLPDVVLYSDGRVFSEHSASGSVKEMFQGSVRASVLRSELAIFTKAIKMPTGGWGIPGVSDIPSTQVMVEQSHKKSLAVVYALGFTSGSLSKEAISARAYLSNAISQLILLAGKSRIYKPSRYEVWPIWPYSGPITPGTDTTNPATLFCLSQYGTVVKGTVVLDPPTLSPDLSTEYCHLPDGSFVEEWKYFYQMSKTGILWPTEIAPPSGVCLSVLAKSFASILPSAAAKQWLLPSGAMINLTWRPVLPGEIACKR